MPGAGERLIGSSYIAVLPETSQFRPDADAGIRNALAGLDPQVPVGADTKPFLAQVEASKQAILGANGGKIELYVGANTTGAQRGMAEMLAEGQALRAQLRDIPITTDDNASILAMRSLDAVLDDLLKRMAMLRNARNLNPIQTNALDTELRSAAMGIDSLAIKFAHLGDDFDPERAVTGLATMYAQVLDISAGLKGMKLDPDDFEGRAKLSGFQAQTAALSRMLLGLKADADMTQPRAQIDSLIAQTRKWQQSLEGSEGAGNVNEVAKAENGLSSALGRSTSAANQNADATSRAYHGYGLLGRAISAISNTHVPLFASSMHRADDSVASLDNGILSLVPGLKGLNNSFLFTASGAHMLIESIIEIGAVWGPALIGMTAFGIAAYPIGKDIYTQWSNMRTVVEATGQSLKSQATGLTSMKSGISGVEAAIKPEVLQLWGDFLTLKGSSHFTDVLQQIGGVLDDFGAKLAIDLNSATTHKFLEHAASDIAGIGDGFAQLGRIIGTLIQAVPGYAELLLKLGDAGLTGIADLVHAAEPAIAIFLKLHGAIFYLGLASTALLTFGRAAVVAFGEVALGNAAVEVSGGLLGKWGAALGAAAGGLYTAGKATLVFAADLIGLSGAEVAADAAAGLMTVGLLALPWVAAAAGAAVVGGIIGTLVYASFTHASDSAAKLNAQLEKMIQASTIVTVQSNIAAAVKQTSEAIKQDTYVMGNLTQASNEAARAGNTAFSQSLANRAKDYGQQIAESNAHIREFAEQNATVAIRLDGLSKTYGGTTAALELFTLAGVSAGDLATKNAKQWAQDEQMLAATAAAYGFMGQQAGTLGNQLDTLKISTGTTAQAVQTLTSAEGSWLTLITGGESSFASFIQGNQTLASDLGSVATVASRTVGAGGKLVTTYASVKGSLQGTSAAALTARSQFDQQISAAGTLYGSLQTLAAASGNTAAAQRTLANAGQQIIRTLIPYAKTSKEATSETYALAQILGYTGSNSLAGMAKWARTAGNATQNLDKDQQNLTATSATLSTAAKNLGNALSADVTASQAQAILSSVKFTTVQDNLINALEKSKGSLSANAKILAGQYYLALVEAGYGTSQARQDTDALVQMLGKTPSAISAVNSHLAALQTEANNAAAAESNAANKAAYLRAQLEYLTSQSWTVRVTDAISQTQSYAPGVSVNPPHKAAGGVIKGSGASGRDSTLIMAAPGEVIVPAGHAAKYAAQFKADGIPGFAAGGMPVSSSPFTSASQSLSSLLSGNLYGYGQTALNPLLNAAEAAVTGPQMQPATQAQMMRLLQLTQQLVTLLQQQPAAIGKTLSNATGSGARKAWGS